MSDSLLIALQIIAALSIIAVGSYVIARKSKRAGMAVASAGSFIGVVLIVNYFEEVPLVIVEASFAALVASMILALFEAVRMDATSSST